MTAMLTKTVPETCDNRVSISSNFKDFRSPVRGVMIQTWGSQFPV